MTFAHGHALLIGIGTYDAAPRLDVPGTRADAEALAGILRDPALCGYPPGQVRLLSGPRATRAHILAALEGLAGRGGVDDTLVIFYSGHGDYASGGAYCLTAHDTRLGPGGVDPATAVSEAELLAALRALPARRVLLLLNACHAGALAPALDAPGGGGRSLPERTGAAVLATGEGRCIITACRAEQVAYLGAGEGTIFGRALAAAWREAPGSAGALGLFELYQQLYHNVLELVAREVPPAPGQPAGGRQEPELTVLKGVGPFAVALRPGRAPADEPHAAPPAPADAAARAPPAPPIREVPADESRAMLRQLLAAARTARVAPRAGGDVIIAEIGAGARGSAVGKGIVQVLGDPGQATAAAAARQLDELLATLDSSGADPQLAAVARFQLGLLRGELAGSPESPSLNTITQVGDWLLANVPQLTPGLARLFALPEIRAACGRVGAAAWAARRFGPL